jgi:hypothetical protein
MYTNACIDYGQCIVGVTRFRQLYFLIHILKMSYNLKRMEYLLVYLFFLVRANGVFITQDLFPM